ncbi:GNAT family N-acetyltransferase [Nocardioides KLBMP 9356]|uniref:GNAT family N-acetyltransferase n=1 Tax=Nocardioides potassii TaxID=2911371 RepID=A0ABS9HCG2_9ACTN|nr:GNAT family N-acetyltransferase [Nocardioides potassii]MCF6378189.1 GNAT family N-acetyltransferase [Nocardioides potassii]
MDADDTVVVRPRRDGDEQQVHALRERSADGGRVAFRPVHRVSDEEAARVRRPGSMSWVAEADGAVVGEASLHLSRVAAGEEVVRLAWLHGLSVDPDWRRRGIARRLTEARLGEVDRLDAPAVVAAAIQAGNAPSMASARRWCDRVLGRVHVTPVPPPRRAPSPHPTVTVRAATADDLDEVAAAVREAARQHALAPVTDAPELSRWLAATVEGDRVHDYLVAVDPAGRLLAGIGLQDEGRVQSLEIVSMPASIRFANRFLHVVPADGRMRNGNVRMPFVRDEAAARHLWQVARWQWRDRTSSLVTMTAPDGPLTAMLASPRWLPRTTLEVVVRDHPDVRLPDLPLAPWA